MASILVPPKLQASTRVTTVDFSPYLATGQTISSVSAAISVYTGADASPSSVIVGTSVSGSVANVTETAGVMGVIYQVRVDATTAAPTNVLSISYFLAIIPDLP